MGHSYQKVALNFGPLNHVTYCKILTNSLIDRKINKYFELLLYDL